MSDQIFFDTNIIVYLYSDDQVGKRTTIEQLLEKKTHVTISTQVINEFAYVMIRKRKLAYSIIMKAIDELEAVFNVTHIDFQTIRYALKIADKHQYSYFDSLMIASAIESGCNIMYTEDLHDSHVIDRKLKIVNPFD